MSDFINVIFMFFVLLVVVNIPVLLFTHFTNAYVLSFCICCLILQCFIEPRKRNYM